MRLAVLKETLEGERRVAIVPESLRRLAAKKIQVAVEGGAGAASFFADDDYRAMGGTVEARDALAATADVFIQIRPPSAADAGKLRAGAALVSAIYPSLNGELVRALAARRVTAFAIDLIPRSTAAQMMDVLSSQATAAGYQAVVMAAAALPRFFPMLMTAAGTIAPARVLILGAGVAGLTAIGTARRLGAVVEAFDVRSVVKEQVESLGAKFVEVSSSEDAQTAGGYAKEASDEYKQRQAAAIAEHAVKADVVICTALIPGRRAPLLLTKEVVRRMRPGSVVVDLAAEQQGNCELTRPGETVVDHGVTVVGDLNYASHVALHASQMYSRNMEKLLLHLTKDGALDVDLTDEITAACLVTHGGAIVRPNANETRP